MRPGESGAPSLMPAPPRPRILLVARYVDPAGDPDARRAHAWARHLAARMPVHLVTHERCREALRDAPIPDARVSFVPRGAFEPRLPRHAREPRNGTGPRQARTPRYARGPRYAGDLPPGPREAAARLAFDRAAVALARRLHDAGSIDTIHRLDPSDLRSPSRLARVGPPLALGPLHAPARAGPEWIDEGRGPRSRGILPGFLTNMETTLREAAVLLADSESTREALPATTRRAAIVLPRDALDLAGQPCAIERSGPTLRLLLLGPLEAAGPRRAHPCLELLADALTLLPAGVPVHLDIVGDGPGRDPLERRVARLRLGARVTFHGDAPAMTRPRWLRAADVVVDPVAGPGSALRALESMAAGTPVLAADQGEMRGMVPSRCGIRIPARSPRGFVHALAASIRHLATIEEERRAMARAARTWVERHGTWDALADTVLDLHEQLRLTRGETRGGAG